MGEGEGPLVNGDAAAVAASSGAAKLSSKEGSPGASHLPSTEKAAGNGQPESIEALSTEKATRPGESLGTEKPQTTDKPSHQDTSTSGSKPASTRASPEVATTQVKEKPRTSLNKRQRTDEEAPPSKRRRGSSGDGRKPGQRGSEDSCTSPKRRRGSSDESSKRRRRSPSGEAAPTSKSRTEGIHTTSKRRNDGDETATTKSTASSKRRRSDPDDENLAVPAKSTRAQNAASQKQSDASSQDDVGSSPYGTRSRGRGGQSRPNYAEDDMEFEYTTSKRTSNGVVKHEAEPEKLPVSRRAAAAKAAENLSVNGSPAPSQHTPAVNGDRLSDSPPPPPPPPPSQPKKRKNAAQAATAPAPAPATTRKTTHTTGGAGAERELGVLSFDRTKACLQNGAVVTDDKLEFRVNDFVYLVCEPPGEPYYIARIMEFIHRNSDPTAPVEFMRVNWMYRPRDIGRKATDSRLVFASMHADQSPLLSLRGKCRVDHRARIADLDAYRKDKDSFYFVQMYERYMHRYYEVVPREKITNIASSLKKIIDDQWEFLISESSKVKELTSASKTCKVCGEYCPNPESVDCAVCKNTYHMGCIDPPLTKKPSRGFAWSCGPCSRRQERKLEARNTPTVGEKGDGDEEEAHEEEESLRHAIARRTKTNSPTADKPSQDEAPKRDRHPLASIWPWRYLGIHSKNEDLLDFDDRIHPRAGMRVGRQHQAVVPSWYGHPVEYIAQETRKKQAKNASKKDAKVSKEAQAVIDEERSVRAKTPWIQSRPPGYQERGLDLPSDDKKRTAGCLFRLPEVGEHSSRGEDDGVQISREERAQAVEDYMKRARQEVVNRRGKDKSGKGVVEEYNTEVLDKALNLFYTNEYNADAALTKFKKFIDSFQPHALEGEELKKFEEGVTKYGSSLQDITRHVKTRHFGDIVRFYYTWKKTKRGREIWDNYEGRKAKKESKRNDRSGLVDDVADDADDSAFDSGKAVTKRKAFECKFCSSRESRAWRRAPQTATGQVVVDGRNRNCNFLVALCQRCALLWRKYAVHYENIDELGKRIAATGSKTLKRKPDEELFYELAFANIAAGVTLQPATVTVAQSIGITVPARLVWNPEAEAAKKKKLEKETLPPAPPPEPVKKKPVEKVEKPVEPPLVPDPPRLKVLPCAVCGEQSPEGEEVFSCRHCRMTVHRLCFGIPASRLPAKWACDTCLNDGNNQNSTNYECVLCPTPTVAVDLYEPPRPAHRKKTDREKEKERLERDMIAASAKEYVRKQEELGRPAVPREALKATVGHKWMHVTCATWVGPIKFRDPAAFDKPEGLLSIPPNKFTQVCKLCKTDIGVCVTCQKCPATFHVSCAQQHGYAIGFDVTPVKGSRRDAVDCITLGAEGATEKGHVEPVILCKEHPPTKNILHPMNEPAAEGLNALQLYVRHFKLADPALTGTVRKAALIHARANNTVPTRHGSISKEPPTPTAAGKMPDPAPATVRSEEVDADGDRIVHLQTVPQESEPVFKTCARCRAETSPKWHKNVAGHAEWVCHQCLNESMAAGERYPSAPPPPPPPQPQPDASVGHGQAPGRWVNGEAYGKTGGPVVNGIHKAPPPAPPALHTGAAPHQPHPPPHVPHPPPPHQQHPTPPLVSPHHVPPPPRPGSYYEDYRRAPIPPPPQANGHPYGHPVAPPASPYHQPPPHLQSPHQPHAPAHLQSPHAPPSHVHSHGHSPHHSVHSRTHSMHSPRHASTNSAGGSYSHAKSPGPGAGAGAVPGPGPGAGPGPARQGPALGHHATTPSYGSNPPPASVHSPSASGGPYSASPTSATFARLGHGPAGPLRYADDPFATVPAVHSRSRSPVGNEDMVKEEKGGTAGVGRNASRDARLSNLMN